MSKGSKIKKKGNIDYVLFFIVVSVVAIGLVMLYSASSYSAALTKGSSTYFLKKQAVFVVLGFMAIAFFVKTGYQWVKKFAFLWYAFSVFVCFIVLFIGTEINGSKRWISVGPLSFQPSETAKSAIIILLAYLISKIPEAFKDRRKWIKIYAVFVGVLAILIAVENLSTAIIVAGIAFIMVFVASPEYKTFLYLIVLAVVGLVVALLFFGGYRLERVNAWLHPETDGAYQTLQGLYAIGSGGLFGKGLGESIQKQGFVPEAQNDMVFTIICEELGLFGAFCLIALFIFLIYRIVSIGLKAKDMFGSFICIGVASQIAIQSILNIAVVTNSIPNTGVVLPFFSYGGTAIFMLLAEMGLVLAVSKGVNLEQDEE